MKKRYGIPGMLLLCAKAAPVSMAVKAALDVILGLVPLIKALATALFIDTALDIVAKNASLSDAIAPVAAVAGVVAISWLGGQAGNLCKSRIQLRLRARLRPAMTDKCARLEYKHIENPTTWDLITRVTKQPEQELMNGMDAASQGLYLILSVISVLALLLAHVWWAALVTVAFSVPLMCLAVKSGKANYDARRKTEREERMQNYLMETAIAREATEERALFGYADSMSQKFSAAFEHAWKVRYKAELKWFIKLKTSSIIYALISILISLTLVFPAARGTISIGLFTSLVSAAFALVNNMSWGFTYVFDELARKREYMKDMRAFDELTETEGATDAPAYPPVEFESLDINDVSFTYPGTDKKVLDHLSLTIKKGEHISFVGVNGAGKTTLVKLLTGLYGDYEGEILLNGRDIRTYAQAQLKSVFAIVFQDFVRYEATVSQNITAELEGRDAAALGKLGVELAPDAELGRLSESGRELSGGEWQRVAIARALSNPATVRILDEPTSALDPIAESEIYKSFHEESRGITTFFISHRLGSTKLADRICVLSGGSIAEEGDHARLIQMGGLYADMFESQRKWYEV